jgi:hypothetical protein
VTSPTTISWELVPGVRFERTSSRLQRDAFTRLAILALVRISGIEPLSSEWSSEAQPIDQIRIKRWCTISDGDENYFHAIAL